ncbi:hypothetical protein ABHQ57_01675 [Tenacibaculum sp. ZH5_bin.1]|uniref:hypothetical protein n=1 Tax=unclassified Tenacibaculum TaxID=2635139 RepID=UPI0036E9F497
MKKAKLTLEKFRVSKLTNMSVIKGGDSRDGTDGTIIVNGGDRCKKTSREILQ